MCAINLGKGRKLVRQGSEDVSEQKRSVRDVAFGEPEKLDGSELLHQRTIFLPQSRWRSETWVASASPRWIVWLLWIVYLSDEYAKLTISFEYARKNLAWLDSRPRSLNVPGPAEPQSKIRRGFTRKVKVILLVLLLRFFQQTASAISVFPATARCWIRG